MKSFYKKGEVVDVVVVIVGIILVFMALGVFRRPISERTVRDIDTWSDGIDIQDSSFDGRCGIQIVSPVQNSRVGSSFNVSGFVNGCGWEVQNGVVGYAQLVDGVGQIVTNLEPIQVGGQSVSLPIEFNVTLRTHTSVRGNAGVLTIYSTPDASGNYKTERIPVRFK